MKAFVTVVEEGSFTKAGDRLGTSNQLVSKYVSQLEEHLGVRLFNRTTRRVHVTEAGEQCFQQAKSILESVTDMEGYFGELQHSIQGTLRISAPVSFSTLHLSPVIRDFRQQHPDVTINLELNDRKVDVVEEGFDVALRIGRLHDSSYIAKKIVPIRLVLCASPQYAQRVGTLTHPDQLRPEDFLRYTYMDYQQTSNPLMQRLRIINQQRLSKLEANNGEVLMESAIAGEGFILQPTFIVGEALRKKQLVTLLDDYEFPSIHLYAVYPHRKLQPPKLRVFLEFLSSYFGSPPYWDDVNTA